MADIAIPRRTSSITAKSAIPKPNHASRLKPTGGKSVTGTSIINSKAPVTKDPRIVRHDIQKHTLPSPPVLHKSAQSSMAVIPSVTHNRMESSTTFKTVQRPVVVPAGRSTGSVVPERSASFSKKAVAAGRNFVAASRPTAVVVPGCSTTSGPPVVSGSQHRPQNSMVQTTAVPRKASGPTPTSLSCGPLKSMPRVNDYSSTVAVRKPVAAFPGRMTGSRVSKLPSSSSVVIPSMMKRPPVVSTLGASAACVPNGVKKSTACGKGLQQATGGSSSSAGKGVGFGSLASKRPVLVGGVAQPAKRAMPLLGGGGHGLMVAVPSICGGPSGGSVSSGGGARHSGPPNHRMIAELGRPGTPRDMVTSRLYSMFDNPTEEDLDFIDDDDGGVEGGENWRSQLRHITGYDPTKFKDRGEALVSSSYEISKEEVISDVIARREDLEEQRKLLALEKKRKVIEH